MFNLFKKKAYNKIQVDLFDLLVTKTNISNKKVINIYKNTIWLDDFGWSVSDKSILVALSGNNLSESLKIDNFTYFYLLARFNALIDDILKEQKLEKEKQELVNHEEKSRNSLINIMEIIEYKDNNGN